MTRTTHRIDGLARLLAGTRAVAAKPQLPAVSGETSFNRSSLLRAGALGVLAVSLRGVPTARAATAEVAGACTGGSLKACYGTVEKNFDKYVHQICDKLKDNKGDPFGTASYSCYVGWMSSRLDARKECRAKCPKPKSPKGGRGGGGGGGGGGGNPPPGGGKTPSCGYVDCVSGDSCCSVKGSTTPICCAIGCARSGDGCCSSSSDC
jgi:hypothetical protein